MANTRIPNPDCRDGKHGICDGHGWDIDADTAVRCPCTCHANMARSRAMMGNQNAKGRTSEPFGTPPALRNFEGLISGRRTSPIPDNVYMQTKVDEAQEIIRTSPAVRHHMYVNRREGFSILIQAPSVIVPPDSIQCHYRGKVLTVTYVGERTPAECTECGEATPCMNHDPASTWQDRSWSDPVTIEGEALAGQPKGWAPCGCIHIDGVWVTTTGTPCTTHPCTICAMRGDAHLAHVDTTGRRTP